MYIIRFHYLGLQYMLMHFAAFCYDYLSTMHTTCRISLRIQQHRGVSGYDFHMSHHLKVQNQAHELQEIFEAKATLKLLASLTDEQPAIKGDTKNDVILPMAPFVVGLFGCWNPNSFVSGIHVGVCVDTSPSQHISNFSNV